jgi:hypothetical protein
MDDSTEAPTGVRGVRGAIDVVIGSALRDLRQSRLDAASRALYMAMTVEAVHHISEPGGGHRVVGTPDVGEFLCERGMIASHLFDCDDGEAIVWDFNIASGAGDGGTVDLVVGGQRVSDALVESPAWQPFPAFLAHQGGSRIEVHAGVNEDVVVTYMRASVATGVKEVMRRGVFEFPVRGVAGATTFRMMHGIGGFA